MTKLLYVDLETTGIDPFHHGIHQIAAHLYINGRLADRLVMDVRPFPTDVIESKAVAVSDKTVEEIQSESHLLPLDAYQQMVTLILRHIDQSNRSDRLFLIGYNNATFDGPFLQYFFEKNRDRNFFTYFWPDLLDVRILAAQYLMKRRQFMENFKLATVTEYLGIPVDRQRLHEAEYDLQLTRWVHLAVCAPQKSQATHLEACAA